MDPRFKPATAKEMKMKMHIPEVLLRGSTHVTVDTFELVDGFGAIVVEIRYADGSELVGVLTSFDDWHEASWASLSVEGKQAVKNGRAYKHWLGEEL